MAERYEKVDSNTLRIIKTPEVVTSTLDRTEIQTQIDHLELDKAKIQLEIDGLKSQIAILDK